MTNSAAVASNANRYVVNSCLPSCAGSPEGEDGFLVTCPWIGPTTWWAPVTQWAVTPMAIRLPSVMAAKT